MNLAEVGFTQRSAWRGLKGACWKVILLVLVMGAEPRSDVWSGVPSILPNDRWARGARRSGASDLFRYLHAIKGKATGEEAQPPREAYYSTACLVPEVFVCLLL